MRAAQDKDLLLRIGVRQGGCSGFSYVMDFEERSNIQEGDSIVEYEGFSMGKLQACKVWLRAFGVGSKGGVMSLLLVSQQQDPPVSGCSVQVDTG